MTASACSNSQAVPQGASTLVNSTRRLRNTDVHAVKQSIRILLVPLEDLDVLEHLLVHGDFVVVPYRVLTEEVEDDEVGWFECDMLAA